MKGCLALNPVSYPIFSAFAIASSVVPTCEALFLNLRKLLFEHITNENLLGVQDAILDKIRDYKFDNLDEKDKRLFYEN